jgi:predicted enzyme related to lactoylglutathione lyase
MVQDAPGGAWEKSRRMEMKLEVVPMPVSDVDAAKAFYMEQVGFHLDHDVRPGGGMRVVQMTPPGSACSVVVGEGLPLGEPGSVKGVQLVVEDVDAVREELAGRGVPVGEVQQLGPEGSPARGTSSSRTPTAMAGPCRS